MIFYAAISSTAAGVAGSIGASTAAETWQRSGPGNATDIVFDPNSDTDQRRQQPDRQHPHPLRGLPRRGGLPHAQPGPDLEPDGRRPRRPAVSETSPPMAPAGRSPYRPARPPNGAEGPDRPGQARPHRQPAPRHPVRDLALRRGRHRRTTSSTASILTKDNGQNWTKIQHPDRRVQPARRLPGRGRADQRHHPARLQPDPGPRATTTSRWRSTRPTRRSSTSAATPGRPADDPDPGRHEPRRRPALPLPRHRSGRRRRLARRARRARSRSSSRARRSDRL